MLALSGSANVWGATWAGALEREHQQAAPSPELLASQGHGGRMLGARPHSCRTKLNSKQHLRYFRPLARIVECIARGLVKWVCVMK